MPGILGKKLGMTQIFTDDKVIPVTVIEAGPCRVVQLKTKDRDGYSAIQLGFGKKKRINKPTQGHLKKAGIDEPIRYLHEIGVTKSEEYSEGQEIKVDMFNPGDMIDVTGTSIGKGFAGTVKRHHFRRGPMSHGSKSHRLRGASGAGTSPGRVLRGTRMAGRMGGETVTVRNLEVVKVDPARNLLLVKGGIPGPRNGLVMVRKHGD